MFVAQCCSHHHPNKLPMLILICCKLRHDNDLVGGFIPLKNMSLSVGMMTFPIYGKIKKMLQTTNQ
jgi:hypothetical protein